MLFNLGKYFLAFEMCEEFKKRIEKEMSMPEDLSMIKL